MLIINSIPDNQSKNKLIMIIIIIRLFFLKQKKKMTYIQNIYQSLFTYNMCTHHIIIRERYFQKKKNAWMIPEVVYAP